MLHYLKARRGIQRRINTAFVAMTVLCASQPSLGIATAKEMLRCVHQGLEISASHMHRRVVVLECSISLKKKCFSGKVVTCFLLAIFEMLVILRESSCLGVDMIN